MTKPIALSPEDEAQLRSLWFDYLAAMERSREALQVNGMASVEFKMADEEAGRCLLKMKQMLGATGQRWME